jgi:lambda family phage minor tail protein L
MSIENQTLIQSLELPNLVELFEVLYNDVYYRLTNAIRTGSVFWNGEEFHAFPITISDVTFNETNSNDTPKLSVAKRDAYWLSAVYKIPNLKGAKVTYVQTAETYIGVNALSSTPLYLMKRHFTVDQMLSKQAGQLVYGLNTYTNFKQLKYPRRQMLRDNRDKMRFEGLAYTKSV